MKTGDVICPVCNTVNRSLYLEETDGWMECISCGSVVKVNHLKENRPSVYTQDQCKVLLPLPENNGFKMTDSRVGVS